MAFEIYIDKFKLDESKIDGFESFSIERGLDDFYWGYWNNEGLGLATSQADLKIEIKDPNVANYIKAKFEKDGFNANVTGKFIDKASNNSFEMLVDFGTYEEIGCCNVAFSFRPKGSGDLIRAREKVEYGLQLNTEIQVPLRDLPTQVNYEGQDVNYIGDGSMNHYIPLKVGENTFSGGVASDVNIGSTNAFFTSSIESCITITGSLTFTALSNDSGTFGVYLNNFLIDTFPISATVRTQTVTLNTNINVLANEGIELEVRSSFNSNYSFTYSKSLVAINIEKCTDTEIEWKPVKAISVREAFRQLLQNTGKATLDEYIFDDCIFDGYLTNNKGLINESSVINVSLYDLFDELNNKYPASLSIEGTSARLMARCEFLKCNKPYKVKAIEASREINEDIVFSSVKVGYNNWKADNKFGSVEHNGKRDYESSYGLSSKTLSLLNDWSSSSSIISEQIRKEKSSEEIHWIVVDKATLRAETDQYISTDLAQSDRLINLRITPARNANRWAKFIANDLAFTTGEGNYNYTSTDTYDCDCNEVEGTIDENANIKTQSILDPFVYKFSIAKCKTDVNRLKGCVQFEYCGKTKVGFIKSFKYSTDSNEDIEIEAIGLK